jgi:putative ABC transport system permease protein
MAGLFQDVLYGLRMMRKSPGVTALAVVTLALGIGANTAIFSNVNALLLRPFAFPNLDRVTTVWETIPKQDANSVKAAPANFRDWSEQNKTFDYLAAVHGWDANLTGEGVAERVEVIRLLRTSLRCSISHRNWVVRSGARILSMGWGRSAVPKPRFRQQHSGGDPNIVGRNLLLNGRKFAVIRRRIPDLDFPVGAETVDCLDLVRRPVLIEKTTTFK